jgi:hypothetical protein
MELPKPCQSIKNITFFKSIKIQDCKAQRTISWDDELYNDFLNSIFNNIPTGQIILNYISDKNCYEIIDGQHRINVIRDYMTNKIPYKVNNKNIFYQDLNKDYKNIFDSTELFVVEYTNLDDKQIITLYLTINSGIEQDENHITKLINSTQKYQDLIDKIKDKYPDIDNFLFSKIMNISAFIINEYEKYGENNVRFKQLSKVHFKLIIDEINKNYGTEDTKQLLIKVSKILDILFSNLILKNYTFTNNVYVFLCHRLYLDLNPHFICNNADSYNNFLLKISNKNNLSLNELFVEYDKSK